MKMRSSSWFALCMGDAVFLALLLALAGPQGAAGDTLEAFDDAELQKLIRQEQYVIVLFGEYNLYYII